MLRQIDNLQGKTVPSKLLHLRHAAGFCQQLAWVTCLGKQLLFAYYKSIYICIPTYFCIIYMETYVPLVTRAITTKTIFLSSILICTVS